MRTTLRALSALLAYPSPELLAHVGEIRSALAAEGALDARGRAALEPLLRSLETQDLLSAQAAYSELFDRSRSLSLHIFEHVHGDSRERGQAMIDLGEHYASHGSLMTSSELPDFIPVFLEFASCLPPREARVFLAEPLHVFVALAERLEARGTPYAAVLHAVVRLAGGKVDADALAELEESAASDDTADIDAEWEEAPVTFSTPHEMGGPTGIVAKIRSGRRPPSAAARTQGGERS